MVYNFCKHEGQAVLLVEGQNDCHVVLALCGLHDVPERFGVYDCGSDKSALKRMNALIASQNSPGIIGLVIDADSPDLSGRWNSIKSKLKPHGYEIPDIPVPTGTILQSTTELPRVGIWLMPDNRHDGMLEDFCREMVDVSAWDTVNMCIDIAKQNGCTSFKSVHRAKAFMHTYLAWQDEPGRPLGQAITNTVLRGKTETASTFATWLTELFQ